MTSKLDETPIPSFEVENEIKATKAKRPANKNRTVVKIHEILKQDEMDEVLGTGVIDIDNTKVNDTGRDSVLDSIIDLTELNYSTIPEDYEHRDVDNSEGKQINRIREYWVQFNMFGKSQMPSDATPFTYSPDRNYFVQLVFFLVLVMLICTSGFVYYVYNTDLRYTFLRYGLLFAIIGMVGVMGISYAMACSSCTRVPPCNFICLILAVCFLSLVVAYITARYRTLLIFVALMATTITVLVCLALACSSFDFTRFMLYLVAVSVAFFAVVILVMVTQMITGESFKPLHVVLLVIGTLIQVVFFIMELQMVLGGRAVELSENDYAYGAFILYTSIVHLFLNILQLFGMMDD